MKPILVDGSEKEYKGETFKACANGIRDVKIRNEK